MKIEKARGWKSAQVITSNLFPDWEAVTRKMREIAGALNDGYIGGLRSATFFAGLAYLSQYILRDDGELERKNFVSQSAVAEAFSCSTESIRNHYRRIGYAADVLADYGGGRPRSKAVIDAYRDKKSY